jgi:3-deoxy-D-manno-octulosonate 8-phosphate phosphatase (KDO 8-P phosphatase)
MNINELDALILDFDGVLTDNKVYIDENGKELVCCSRADGLAFDALRKLQIPVYILSTESNPVVSARAHKLKVPVIQGVKSKIDSLKSLCTEHNYNSSKILFVGNDLNDYQVIEYCGFSACPADSHDSIKNISTFVCSTNGGEGIVREILEVVFKLNLLKILF